jgi:P pilus assembly chaperone PapD
LHLSSPNLLLLAVIALVPALARAGAVLFLYPPELVVEDNQRSAEITLSNQGDQTGTFQMDWTHMTMAPEGGLVKYDGQPRWSIQPYVRYSPRRVTLVPSESQVIKIALRRGQNVPEGEYYSHFRVLTLRSEDPSAAEASADEPDEPDEAFSVSARSAVAIPIIWRNSRAKSSASIESVRIDQNANRLTVDVRRHGLLSVRGYLHLFESAPNGTRSSLAEPVPLVIYPSIDARTTTIELMDGVMADNLPHGTALYYSPDLLINDRSTLFASYPIVP